MYDVCLPCRMKYGVVGLLTAMLCLLGHRGVSAVDLKGNMEERASAGDKSASVDYVSQLLVRKRPSLKATFQKKKKVVPHKKTPPQMCNGQNICDRKYGDVTFAATHNSYAVECTGEKGVDYVDWCHWANGLAAVGSLNILDVSTNHDEGLRTQWRSGIRGFLIDTYEVGPGIDSVSKAKEKVGLSPQKPGIKLCHGDCAIGQVDAVKWLRELRRLMTASPNEIVTLWIEDYTSPAKIFRTLRKAGFTKWFDVDKESRSGKSIRSQTLSDLIKEGNQLVVGIQGGRGLQQNPWVLRDQNELHDPAKCQFGSSPIHPTSLYSMNQFMAIHAGTPSRDMSTLANKKANVHKRLCMCQKRTGVRPSLVSVDHFQVGDVFGAVRDFNQNGCSEDMKWAGWRDGQMCALGSTCHRCKNKASLWKYKGIPMTRCGKEFKGGECERTKWYKTCGGHSECRPKKSNPCRGKCVCDKFRVNECKCVQTEEEARTVKATNKKVESKWRLKSFTSKTTALAKSASKKWRSLKLFRL